MQLLSTGIDTSHELYVSGLDDGWAAFILTIPTDSGLTWKGVGGPFGGAYKQVILTGDDAFGLDDYNNSYDPLYGSSDQGTFAAPITIDIILPSLQLISSKSGGNPTDQHESISISAATSNTNLMLPDVDQRLNFNKTEYTYWEASEGSDLLDFNSTNHTDGGGWYNDATYLYPSGIKMVTRTINLADLSETQQDNIDKYFTSGNVENEYPLGVGMRFFGADNLGVGTREGEAALSILTTASGIAPQVRKLGLRPSRRIDSGSDLPSGTRFKALVNGENTSPYSGSYEASSLASEFDIVESIKDTLEDSRSSAASTGQTPWASTEVESYSNCTIKVFNNASTITGDSTAANAYFLITHVSGNAVTSSNIADYVLGFKNLTSNIALRLSGGSVSFDAANVYKIKDIKESEGDNGTGVQVNIITSSGVAPSDVYRLNVENAGPADQTSTSVTLEIANIIVSGNNPNLYPNNQISANTTTSGNMRVRKFENDVVMANKLSSTSGFLRIETKDIDFGSPSVEKILYKIELTASFVGKLQVQWAANNNAFTGSNKMFTSNGSTSVNVASTDPFNPNSLNMRKYTFYFNADKSPIRRGVVGDQINSIRFKLMPETGDSISTLNLNDISILYREKGAR